MLLAICLCAVMQLTGHLSRVELRLCLKAAGRGSDTTHDPESTGGSNRKWMASILLTNTFLMFWQNKINCCEGTVNNNNKKKKLL